MDRGERVLDRFEIEAAVGRGAAGAVYRARDLSTGALVALKVLRSSEPLDAARFSSEAMLLKMLDDPAIVRYVAQGRTREGDPFVALEWLEGGTLKDRLAEGPLSVDDALTVATRVCHALLTLGRRRVVHRDIKPGNIAMVGGVAQRTKLFDFGIARFLETQDVSEEGTLLGTPGYLAPEQVRGELSVDPRADLFALGAVLYECLTGARAFQDDDSIALLLKVMLEDPTPPSEVRPDIPRQVDSLVKTLLDKNRDGRPADAGIALGLLVSLSEELRSHADLPLSEAPRSAIGKAETRVVSVVLANPRAAKQKSALVRARSEMAPLGVELVELVDGSVHAFSRSRGAEAMAASARAALVLAGALGDDARIALASGRALFDGRMELKGVIERAARQLRRDDAPGVVVDDVTLGLLGGQFEAYRRQTARGEAELVLAGERGASSTEKTLLGMPTLYLGRERELFMLQQTFDDYAAIESSPSLRPAFVWITGEQGYGKSRLGDEFANAISDTEHLRLHRARAHSFGAAPLSLLGDLLRNALGLSDVDEKREAHDRLLAAGADTLDPLRTAAFLGEIAGFSFPDTASPTLVLARGEAQVFGDQLARAFEEWLIGECDLGPVLLLLDDIHLADAASLGLLARVRAHLERHVFIVALGVHSDKSPLGEPTYSIRLDALENAAARRIVEASSAADLPASVIDGIVERAAGNAFFLEELVRSREATHPGADDQPLSKLLLATVEERLLALDGDARRFLRAASIVGDPFDLHLVAELMGVDVARAEDLGQALDRDEVVRRTGQRTMSFRHSLLAEAAGAMLTDSDRALGHALAAVWLSNQPRASALAIAEHYVAAGDSAKAAHYFYDAAKLALSSNDFEGVISIAARVLESLPSASSGDMYLLVAEAHRWLGNHQEAARAAVTARDIFERGSDGSYRALGEWALASGRLGNLDDLAHAVYELRKAQPGKLRPESRRRVRIASALASLHLMTRGRQALAEELIDDLFRDTAEDDLSVTARIHQTAGFRALLSGDLGGYLAHMRKAVSAFEAAGDAREACLQGVNLGNAALQLGEYEHAEKALNASRKAALLLGLRHVVAYADHNLGIVLLHLGRPDKAQRVEELAIEAFVSSGDKRMEGAARVYAAMIELWAGRIDTAHREAARGVELLADTPPARACALATLAAAELAQSSAESLEQADSHSAEAHRILTDLGGIEEGEALVRLIRAEVLMARGEVERGLALANEAASLLRQRALRVSDPAARESFLRRVPENRRTFEMVERWSALPKPSS